MSGSGSGDLPPLSDAFTRRYRISRLLGEGGMGTVHLAWDEELSRQVAIKFLRTFGEGRDSLAGKRFEEEARVCAQLKHPRIVRLYTLDWEGDVPYLVFEFVMGSSLADEIDSTRRMPLTRTVAVGLDLLAALAAAHELGVVHRDVKPANVLIRSEDARAMLADFGLARSTERTSFKTAKNIVLGTPAFMAPEVLLGEAAGPGADLYGVGCALYACLTGKPPLVGRTDVHTLELQLREVPKRPGEVVGGIPAALDDFVMQALAKKPEGRAPSAAAMAEALSALAQREGLIDGTTASGTRLPIQARDLSGAPSGALQGPTRVATRVPSQAAEPAARVTPSTKSGEGPARALSKSAPAVTRPLNLSKSGESPGRPLARTRPGELVSRSLSVAPPAAAPETLVRRALAAGLVIVTLMGLGFGAWWWMSRGRLIGAHVIVQQGAATITWETPRSLLGRVVLREDVSGGRTEEVWEPSAAHMHSVTLRDLRAGVPMTLAVVLAGELPAWSVRFTPPAPLVARVSSVGATRARVALQGPAPAEVDLKLAGAHEGETFRVGPGGTADVPYAAAGIVPGARLVQTLAPGVTAEHRVLTVSDSASRLADALEQFQPGQLVAKIVRKREFDTWKDFNKSLGAYAAFAHGEVDKPAVPVKPDFKKHVLALAVQLPFWAELALFRPEADAYFTEPSIPDTDKLRLYRGLLKLRTLDQLCAAQHDPDHFHTEDLYSAFVRAQYTWPAPPKDPSGPASLFPAVPSFQTSDFFDSPGLMRWVRTSQTFGKLHPDIDLESLAAVKTALRPDRTVRLPEIAGAGGAGTAKLHAVVLNLGPSYHFEITVSGGGAALPLLIAHPGTTDWFEAMDVVAPGWDERKMPVPSSRPPELTGLEWGQVDLTFPARLLPRGPIAVRVGYAHLPGVAIDKLANIQRLAHLREITLTVNSVR